MNPLVYVAIPLTLLVSAPAQSSSVLIDCASSTIVEADVDKVLGPSQGLRTHALRSGLLRAIREACEQDVASIVVTPRGTRVDWAPAAEVSADLAAR